MLSNPAAASRITPIFLFSNSSSLLTGAVDPSTALPQYISDLKAAGLDEIKADVEKQYNEWKAAK